MTTTTTRIAELRQELATLEAQELEEKAAALRALPDADLIDPDPKYRGSADYILPFGREYRKWNPLDPAAHPFGKEWLAGGSTILCQRTDEARDFATRAVHTSGAVSEDFRVGNTWTFRHDQTNGRLGTYKVVGIVMYGPDGEVARTAGVVTTRKLSLNTFK
jgi:hypothetical protein